MQQNIRFVPKGDNPPNVPQARPIEHFWALLSQKVYDSGWQATTYAALRRRIKTKLREFNLDIVQQTMSCVCHKLRAIADHGPLNVGFL